MKLIRQAKPAVLIVVLWVFCSVGYAGQITGTDLLNLLIDNEVLTKEQAQVLVDDVRARNNVKTAEDGISGRDFLDLLLNNKIISQQSYDQLLSKIEKRNAAEGVVQENDAAIGMGKAVRVPYIPDYIQKEMHESLKYSVEADVVDKVKDEAVRTARVYGWGIKESPSWVHKVKLSGDGRIRYQADLFPDDNKQFGAPDYNGTNDSGQLEVNNAMDDRHRFRARFRLKVQAKPTDRLEVGMRFVTGDEGNPVSSNQTLGSFSQKWDTNLDMGYIKYESLINDVMLEGGRFENPFLHTDLVYDSDMMFEGLAGTYYFARDDSPFSDQTQWDPYFTLGIFPVQEVHLSTISQDQEVIDIVAENNENDKYLFALQFATDYHFLNTNKLSLGLAYYHYENMRGIRNPPNLDINDVSASKFYQVGNSVYDIAAPTSDDITIALAADYHLVNATVKYQMADFFPTYVFLQGDYVKNIGFDREEVSALTNLDTPDRDVGYQVGLNVGTLNMKFRRDWRVSFIYRHLEGDAVLDAFADSDFMLGGTDAKGYIIEALYGVFDNGVASIKWISADSIDVDPDDALFNIGVDTLQVDFSAKF